MVVFKSDQLKHTCTLWSKAVHKVESYHNQSLYHMVPTTHTGEGGRRERGEGGREGGREEGREGGRERKREGKREEEKKGGK